MKKILIPIILVISISLNAFAQDKSKQEEKGDKYYFVYSFDKAIKAYKEAKDLSLDGQRKLAKSYYNTDKFAQAEEVYSKLVATAGGNTADDYYNFAMALRSDGKADEANKQMDKFKELKPDDLRAKDYDAKKGSLSDMMKDDGKYAIDHQTVNTDAEDFSPVYYKNQIVFASSRNSKMFAKKSNWNKKPFLKLYVSDIENMQMKNPVMLDKSLKGKKNIGPASFNKDANFMAYTINNTTVKKKEKIVKLEIYFRSYADGKWSAPEAFTYNNKEYSVGHPCLTGDGKTMYFSSDGPGGLGGVDLYKSTKNDKGEWSKPENLGNKINTEGDEMFPFFEEKTSTLFFSSNGRFGLGGLDVFYTRIIGDGFVAPVNAGSPLNTQYDDFGVISDNLISKGYFSSNRPGGNGDDDIYAVTFLKPLQIGKKISGVAKDDKGNPLAGATLKLINSDGKELETVTTGDDGSYSFTPVDADKNFKITGKKDKYNDVETPVSSSGKDYNVKADITFVSAPPTQEEKEQNMKDGDDAGKVVQFKPIYFDLRESAIRADAEPELEKIVTLMNKYPNMVIECRAYTDCRATMEYNQALSERRATATINYIKKKISNPKRITGKGFGENNLVNKCACEGAEKSDCSEEEQQKNRRTEFIVVKKQ